MICKEVNYKLAIDEWSALIDGGTLSSEKTKTAKMHLAGLKAEKNMAYYLKARFAGTPELLVFNNLKFEHLDRTAQIDHLVLSRWSAYFIETKSVSAKININANLQWSRTYRKGKYDNFESPLEQSRRHEPCLFDLLESRLPDFMGKIVGMQKTFCNTIDVQHLIAVSVGATIQGKGQKDVSDHLRPLDQIPQLIADNHQAVRSSLLGSAIAEMRDAKTRKHDPAFSKKELDACRRLLLDVDISQSPLEFVHEFIESLPERPADKSSQSQIPNTKSQIGDPKSVAPRCPKCDSEMVLRTAKRGDRKGKQFYGCSRYPKCREMINVD
ncbi:MAG: NERD domain-containing protein [Phycisphaerae bacterium]|nr:NERD domain-containing protein [Planctomycetota bacterium]MBL7220557.1 NERD domain-containing protein [Phycisphaerae bacterium]